MAKKIIKYVVDKDNYFMQYSISVKIKFLFFLTTVLLLISFSTRHALAAPINNPNFPTISTVEEMIANATLSIPTDLTETIVNLQNLFNNAQEQIIAIETQVKFITDNVALLNSATLNLQLQVNQALKSINSQQAQIDNLTTTVNDQQQMINNLDAKVSELTNSILTPTPTMTPPTPTPFPEGCGCAPGTGQSGKQEGGGCQHYGNPAYNTYCGLDCTGPIVCK